MHTTVAGSLSGGFGGSAGADAMIVVFCIGKVRAEWAVESSGLLLPGSSVQNRLGYASLALNQIHMYCKPRQQAYIRLYNNCLRDRATNCPDLVVGLHLCRGTEHPSHLLAKHLVDDSRKIGNFRYIYPFLGVKLFNEINVGTYYLGTTPRERDTLRPSSISPRTSPSSFS